MTMKDNPHRSLASTSDLNAVERKAVRASLAVVGIFVLAMIGGAVAIGVSAPKTADLGPGEPARIMAWAVSPQSALQPPAAAHP